MPKEDRRAKRPLKRGPWGRSEWIPRPGLRKMLGLVTHFNVPACLRVRGSVRWYRDGWLVKTQITIPDIIWLSENVSPPTMTNRIATSRVTVDSGWAFHRPQLRGGIYEFTGRVCLRKLKCHTNDNHHFPGTDWSLSPMNTTLRKHP